MTPLLCSDLWQRWAISLASACGQPESQQRYTNAHLTQELYGDATHLEPFVRDTLCDPQGLTVQDFSLNSGRLGRCLTTGRYASRRGRLCYLVALSEPGPEAGPSLRRVHSLRMLAHDKLYSPTSPLSQQRASCLRV